MMTLEIFSSLSVSVINNQEKQLEEKSISNRISPPPPFIEMYLGLSRFL